MGMRKPLTEREKYLAKKCGLLHLRRYVDGNSITKIKPAKAVRALLKFRKEKPNYAKWGKMSERLKEGFKTFDEFRNVYWQYRELDKYQGYIVGQFVEAESEIEGLSEEQVRRMNVLEAI